MRLSSQSDELMRVIQGILDHLELLMEEWKSLSAQELELLSQLADHLPEDLGQMRQEIAFRLKWLLRRYAKRDRSESAAQMSLRLPKSASLPLGNANAVEASKVNTERLAGLLQELRAARNHRQPRLMVEVEIS